MKNANNNNYEVLKNDLIMMKEYFAQYKIELMSYREEDIPELFDEVISLLQNIIEINYFIAYTKYIINDLSSKESELISKLNITFEDINKNLKENSAKILNLYLLLITVPMTISLYDLEAYLKFVLNITSASTIGFTINCTYLLSNLRKRIINTKITKINNEISLCERDIELFEEAIEEFVLMLESTLNRLNELTPRIKDNENYEEYFKRIYGDKYDALMLSYVKSQSKQYIRKRERNERNNN